MTTVVGRFRWALGVFLGGLCLLTSAAADEEAEYVKKYAIEILDSFDEAMREARSTGKNVLVWFSHTPCERCARRHSEFFSEPRIRELGRQFVVARGLMKSAGSERRFASSFEGIWSRLKDLGQPLYTFPIVAGFTVEGSVLHVTRPQDLTDGAVIEEFLSAARQWKAESAALRAFSPTAGIRDPAALESKAKHLLRLGRWEEAEAVLKRLSRLTPSPATRADYLLFALIRSKQEQRSVLQVALQRLAMDAVAHQVSNIWRLWLAVPGSAPAVTVARDWSRTVSGGALHRYLSDWALAHLVRMGGGSVSYRLSDSVREALADIRREAEDTDDEKLTVWADSFEAITTYLPGLKKADEKLAVVQQMCAAIPGARGEPWVWALRLRLVRAILWHLDAQTRAELPPKTVEREVGHLLKTPSAAPWVVGDLARLPSELVRLEEFETLGRLVGPLAEWADQIGLLDARVIALHARLCHEDPKLVDISRRQLEASLEYTMPVLVQRSGLKFVLIPPGISRAGFHEREKFPDKGSEWRKVTFDAPFYLMQTELTIGDYRRYRPSYSVGRNAGASGGNDYPVPDLSWRDAVGYTKWLSARDDEYTYRLPTEDEWEYAARAGWATTYWWGPLWKRGKGKGNFADARMKAEDSKNPSTVPPFGDYLDADDGHLGAAPVGSYEPNRWQLYDVLGNVWEWARARSGAPTAARGIPGTHRGGDYYSGSLAARLARRGRGSTGGVRLVLERIGGTAKPTRK